MLESAVAPAFGAREARPRTAAILSVASELPEGKLTNAELAERLGVTEEWIMHRTGIRERRRAEPDERLSDYATRVGRKALDAAGVPAAEIDLVLVATVSQDELTPNTAPIVADALGTGGAGAIDVGAACTSFLSGLSLGTSQIESGRVDRVLLIGADFITRIVNYDDKRSAPLFADAAGAVVLGVAEPGQGAVGPIVLGSDGSHARTLFAPLSTRLVEMNGPEVFKHAVARMGEATLEVVALAGLDLEEIDLFVFHQANARITKSLGEKLGLDPERVVDCIEMLGNASAATLPVALEIAQTDGRLKPGARILLSAFGAGFTWGGGVVQWGGGRDG